MYVIDEKIRRKALDLYRQSKGQITCKQIALELDLKANTVAMWKRKFKWDRLIGKGPGAPLGNRNAKGNDGGGPTKIYRKYQLGDYLSLMPEKSRRRMMKLESATPLERLYRCIVLQESEVYAIMENMHVEDINDLTKELKKCSSGKSGDSEEYELVFAWDKQSKKQATLASAMKTLNMLQNSYVKLCQSEADQMTYEQRTKFEQLKEKQEHRIMIDKNRIELEREKFEHKKAQDLNNSW
jgi:uncharacterized protein YjcR